MGSEEASLAPTLRTIEDLYWKAERELYRTWHARSAYHKADHFYNFCITAHALRDYYLLMLDTSSLQADTQHQHEAWNRVEIIRAVKDIANSAKHWKLRRAANTRGVRLGEDIAVDIYLSSADEVVLEQVKMPGWIVEVGSGAEYDTLSFLQEVLDYWKQFLESKGIALRRQPRSIFYGDDETEFLGTIDGRHVL